MAFFQMHRMWIYFIFVIFYSQIGLQKNFDGLRLEIGLHFLGVLFLI